MGDLLEVGDNVINSVVARLNYSSVDSFYQDVSNIKEWMKKQPHLPEIMNDKKIENFLILNRGSVENAKEKIDNYYTMRSQLPHIFDDANPKLPFMTKNYDTFYFVPLPRLTKDMFRIFMFKLRKTKLKEKYNPIDIIRYLLNFQEIRLVDDVIYGDIIILDGRDAPLNFVLNFTPTIFYTLLIIIYKNVYSNRMKALHIVHAPSFAEKFIAIVKLILGSKVIGRIHFHQNYDFLGEMYGKETIPVDFGGEEKSLAELQTMVIKKFEDYADMFDDLDKLRVREGMRHREVKSHELISLQGNFKKLEVD